MNNPIDTAKIYTDFQGFSELRQQVSMKDEKALQKVAEQFEAIFIHMALKSMRDANRAFESELFSSNQSEFYQSMYDQQLTLSLSSGNGLGLAEMLVRQLSPEYQSKDSPDEDKKNLIINRTEHSKENTKEIAPVRQEPTIKATPVPEASHQKLEVPREGKIQYSSPSEFVSDMIHYAKEAAELLGVSPKFLVAQAALETGWGRSIMKKADGSSSYNLFGIKADRSWNKEKVNVQTLEYRDNTPRKEMANFRSYQSFAESFMDYVNFLTSNPRYKNALEQRAIPGKFAEGLQNAGYATDPKYADKIQKIYKSDIIENAARKAGIE